MPQHDHYLLDTIFTIIIQDKQNKKYKSLSYKKFRKNNILEPSLVDGPINCEIYELTGHYSDEDKYDYYRIAQVIDGNNTYKTGKFYRVNVGNNDYGLGDEVHVQGYPTPQTGGRSRRRRRTNRRRRSSRR